MYSHRFGSFPSKLSVAQAALVAVAATASSAFAGTALVSVDSVPSNKATALALNSDGSYVYVAGSKSWFVEVYERDAVTGEFGNLVELDTDGVCVDGLVGSGCASDIDCLGGGDRQDCLFPFLGSRVRFAITSDGACLYAASEDESGIVVYDRNALDGTVSMAGFVGSDICSAGIVGKRCTNDNECDTFPAAGDGSCLTDAPRKLRDFELSSDDAFAYAVGTSNDGIMVLARPGTGCGLSVEQVLFAKIDLDGFSNPTGVALSPDDANVYAAVATGDRLQQFSRAGDGTLTPTHIAATGECLSGDIGAPCAENDDCQVGGSGPGNCSIVIPTLDGARSVIVSPDGEHVYVAGGAGITVFDRDTGDATAPLIEIQQIDATEYRLERAVDLAFTSDGTRLLHGSDVGDLLLVFERDPVSGVIAPLAGQGPADVHAIVLSPDQSFVYTAGLESANAYASFSTVECSALPLLGCTSPSGPGASLVKLFDKSKDSADKALWKWGNDAATTIPAFGDPATTTSYAFCVWDSSGAGATDALVMSNRINPGGGCIAGSGAKDCWKANTRGYRFKDKGGVPDGVQKLKLKADDTPGRAKLQLLAKRGSAGLPLLGLSLPVTVQLQNSIGQCWEAGYTGALRNEPGRFSAVSD